MPVLDIQTILLPRECFLETEENRRLASEVGAAWILVAVVDCPPFLQAVVVFLHLCFLSVVVYILVAVVDSPSPLRVAVGIVATEFVPLVAFLCICVVYLSDLATVHFPVVAMVFPFLHLGPRCVLSALKEDILGRDSVRCILGDISKALYFHHHLSKAIYQRHKLKVGLSSSYLYYLIKHEIL